jgi:hypothetical protein
MHWFTLPYLKPPVLILALTCCLVLFGRQAKADDVALFDVTGLFISGETLSGTISFDLTNSTFVSSNLLTTIPGTTDFDTYLGLGLGIDSAIFLQDTVGDDLRLEFPIPNYDTLAGFDGGPLITLPDYSFLDIGPTTFSTLGVCPSCTSYLFESGEITPEPRGMALLLAVALLLVAKFRPTHF